MARPILQLSSVTLSPTPQPLFSNLSLTVHPGARIALVGRNGAGKSSLLQVLAGLREADSGTLTRAPGACINYMAQEPDFSAFTTLGAFASASLGEGEEHLALRFAQGLKFDPDAPVETASGGQKRRAALAALLAERPDLLLLDEPTNHLDIEAITWLENYLVSTAQALIAVSHDRQFLKKISREILWLDRGELRYHSKGFSDFEHWRDLTWAQEDAARHKLNQKIKAEAHWAVEGISARRRRNQGRLRALNEMRETRSKMIARPKQAALKFEEGAISGKLIIEAKDVCLRFETEIVKNFSAKILRGDRVGIIGANGVGKTTLIKLLMKEIEPDSGVIRHGTRLNPAIFDQNRDGLVKDATLWETLTMDPETGVSGRSDQVMVRGKPKHVVGYLKEFLFDETMARAKVATLSGGEKARLMLAKLMAKESNLLILDEPTNDLDVETLDLLQEVMDSYQGSIFLISHDRDFLDRVVNTTIALEGAGRVGFYAGGFGDYLAQRGRGDGLAGAGMNSQQSNQGKAKGRANDTEMRDGVDAKALKKLGLTFTERHRLVEIPSEIKVLEAEITRLEDFLNAAEVFQNTPEKAAGAGQAIASRRKRITALEAAWFALAQKEAASKEDTESS